MADEVVKVKLDISDVIVKRTAEINEAKRAEKEKIAALKRESAAAAREDKEAWALSLAAAKKAAADEEAAAKKLADAQQREDKKAFDFAVALAKKEAAEKARLNAQLAKGREAQFAVRMETATEAVQDQRVHIDALRGRMNLLGEGLGKAGSAAAALGPEFGGLAQGMQKAGGAASAMLTAVSAFGGPAGVALGVALAAATAAWGAHAEQVKANEEALKAAKEEAEETSSVFGQLADDLFEATLQQKVLNKEITQADADIQRAAHGINEAYGPALETALDKMNALKVAIAEQGEVQKKALDKQRQGNVDQGPVLDKSRAKQAELNDELGRAEEAYDRLQASMNNLGTVQEGNIVKTAKQKKAVKETKEEVEELTTAEESYYDQRLDYLAQVEAAEAKAREDAEAATKIAVEAGATREEQFIADQERMDAWIEKQKEAREATYETTADIASSASSVADSIGSLFQDALDTRTDYIDELNDEYEEALEEGDDAKAASLKKQMKAEQEAALKTFRINKALTITSASLSTVAAAAKALEAGWPALLITVPAALAAGGAQIALAAKQKPPEFDDTNQIRQAVAAQGDNRVNVSAKNGDLVAMAQTPAGLKKQVDQMGGGQQPSAAARLNDALIGRGLDDLNTLTRGIYRRAA